MGSQHGLVQKCTGHHGIYWHERFLLSIQALAMWAYGHSIQQQGQTDYKYIMKVHDTVSKLWNPLSKCHCCVFPCIGPSVLLVPFLNPYSDSLIVAGSGDGVILVAGAWDGGRVDGDGLLVSFREINGALRWMWLIRLASVRSSLSQRCSKGQDVAPGFFTRKSDVQLFEMLLHMFWLSLRCDLSWASHAEEGSSCSPQIKSVSVSKLRFSCCAKKDQEKSLQQVFFTFLYWIFLNHWSHQKWKSDVLWFSSFQHFIQLVQPHILGRRSFRRHCMETETVHTGKMWRALL